MAMPEQPLSYLSIEIDPGRSALEIRPKKRRPGRKISASEPPKRERRILITQKDPAQVLNTAQTNMSELFSCLLAAPCPLLATRDWTGPALEADRARRRQSRTTGMLRLLRMSP